MRQRIRSEPELLPTEFTIMPDNVSVAERSRIMAAVKSKDTTPEMVVRRLVHSMGFRYRLHDKSLPGKPDLVFTSRQKVINVHGCFWHMHSCGRCRIPASRRGYWTDKLQGNALRDKRNQQRLRRAGWNVLVVWECQAFPTKLKQLRARIASFLENARATPSRKTPC